MTLFQARAPFDQLKAGEYGLIKADPPWHTKMRSPLGEGKSFVKHYGAMSMADIAALPVGDLAAKNCLLFLWCTWPLLLYGGDPTRHYRDADAARSPIGQVIREWGFRYVTGGGWAKRTKNGKLRWGTGYRVRSTLEPFLIGVKGSPANSRSEQNLIDGLAREHSRKPDEAFAWCERWAGDVRRVELFSRQSRKGWDSWGYEAGKFDPVVTMAEAA
jgi:N6-adenosine-specific RNA methylase IME4